MNPEISTFFQYPARSRVIRARADASFGLQAAGGIASFHESVPGFAATPLVSLGELASRLGVASLHVKDESRRFGLGAFKGLGGSWCVARVLAGMTGLAGRPFTFGDVQAAIKTTGLPVQTFVTATDGNHGRGIAWAASLFGQKAVVYMPKGSAIERLEAIMKFGADASILETNYDDTVRHAGKMAEENGWILVQDTSWDGYETIPERVMQGYTTLGVEILAKIPQPPTHIFLQAGVAMNVKYSVQQIDFF